MLQQTQVERVKGFYRDWLLRFPDWPTLARASNADVVRAWSGLGYNRRALALRDIARHIIARGEPNNEAEWLTLKGIGPYTAAAIMSFAYEAKTVPIDTNVRRVVGRWLLGLYFPTLKSDKRVYLALRKIVNTSSNPSKLIQALFDLASGPCGKVPDCKACPLRTTCIASNRFLANQVRIPKKSVKKTRENHYRNRPYPDRIYRGRIVRAVAKQSFNIMQLGAAIDPQFTKEDVPWLKAMVLRLVRDGLASFSRGRVGPPI